MRLPSILSIVNLFTVACSASSPGVSPAGVPGSTASPDLGAPAEPDAAVPGDLGHAADLGPRDGGVLGPDGGNFMPPPASDNPVVHAPPTAITAARTLMSGQNVLDVSVDQGGGVWAVTTTNVSYFAAGSSGAFTYNQSSGLARGQYTWVDTWFNPGTWPVEFHSVAGGMPGQAVIGNFGTIADRLQVNPSTGAVLSIENMKVTPANTTPAEYPEHLKRVVAVWKTVVDLNGTYRGTAYLGGWHGFYAVHGMTADCGCLTFEEHQHYIDQVIIAGDDVRGLAITPQGDLWAGDRDVVQFLPQRSEGPNADFFSTINPAIDVFDNVRDEISAVAVDAAGGVWVASDGNGLAYLAPITHAKTFWSSATTLPQNHLEAVAVDGAGDVWVGTREAGVARLHPATAAWTYYTAASGLPSNQIRAIYYDHLSGGGKVFIATDHGVAAY